MSFACLEPYSSIVVVVDLLLLLVFSFFCFLFFLFLRKNTKLKYFILHYNNQIIYIKKNLSCPRASYCQGSSNEAGFNHTDLIS